MKRPGYDIQLDFPLPPEPMKSRFEAIAENWAECFNAVRLDINDEDGRLSFCWWFDDVEDWGELIKHMRANGLEVTSAGPRQAVN